MSARRTAVPCATDTVKRQHLSRFFLHDTNWNVSIGRAGRTLCGRPGAVDQDRLNFYMKATRRGAVTITDLPLCIKCDAAEKHAEMLERACD